MILLLLLTLACVFVQGDKTAADFKYSASLCKYLDEKNGTTTCQSTIQDVRNKYCENQKSFFSEDDIEMYNEEMLEDYSKDKLVLDALISETNKVIDEMERVCSTDACRNNVKTIRGIFPALKYIDFDIRWMAYTIANRFNFGAICLAANPIDYQAEGLPVIRDDVLTDMEGMCKKALETIVNLGLDAAKALKHLDSGVSKQMQDLVNKTTETEEYKTACSGSLDLVDFQVNTSLMEQYKRIFESTTASFTDTLSLLLECISEGNSIKECSKNIFASGWSPAHGGEREGEERAADRQYLTRDNGFDVLEASLNNPVGELATPLVNELGGRTRLQGWHIALIVIGVAVVVALCVGLGVFFGYVKPKKAAQQKGNAKK